MKIAIFNGLLGTALTAVLGMSQFGFSISDGLLCVLASNLAILLALLVTLRFQRTSWMIRQVRFRTLKAWTLAGTVYLSILWMIAPPLREPMILLTLLLPLLLSMGFGILVFGPIQDWQVRAEQRRSRRT